MYKRVSGIFRILLALITITGFVKNPKVEEWTKNITSNPIGANLALFIVTIFLVIFLSYLIINGLREFNGKPIKHRVLYLFMFLFAVFFAFTIPGFIANNHLISQWVIPTALTFLFLTSLMYFTISDFITLFLKKKSQDKSAINL